MKEATNCIKGEIREFVNEEKGLRLRTIQNQDGRISMNAEDESRLEGDKRIGVHACHIKNTRRSGQGSFILHRRRCCRNLHY